MNTPYEIERRFNKQLRDETSAEFTDAFNLTFLPEALYGHKRVVRQYVDHKNQLPIDINNLESVQPPIDAVTATALNALHSLRVARQNALRKLSPEGNEDWISSHPIVVNAPEEVLVEVTTMQSIIADEITKYSGNTYNMDRHIGLDE